MHVIVEGGSKMMAWPGPGTKGGDVKCSVPEAVQPVGRKGPGLLTGCMVGRVPGGPDTVIMPAAQHSTKQLLNNAPKKMWQASLKDTV